MLKVFNKYVNGFDVSDEMIINKIEHSIRVYEKMREYAKRLGYSEEEITLAGEIGLLHDIGRFRQVEENGSFNDLKTFDHAEYGVYLLFEKNQIEDYKIDSSHYNAMRYAIKNHNKYKLDKCEDRLTMKMAKLIRDVDKMDILYLLGTLGNYDESADDSVVSQKIYESIKSHRSINKEDIKTHNDNIAVKLAFAFDINNDMCLNEFKRNLTAYYKRIERDNRFKDIYEEIIKYLDERMK